MKKTKRYALVRFSPEAIPEAYTVFESLLDEQRKKSLLTHLQIGFDQEEWTHDSEEEFFADIRSEPESYSFGKLYPPYSLVVSFKFNDSEVTVEAPTRSEIEKVFNTFEKNLTSSRIVLPVETEKRVTPTLFIGHGRSDQWRDLKDHLHEQHGYNVEAYEIGARAGHAIRGILEDMLIKSSFAILVLTAEDKDESGSFRARQNVIHELGLFQGHLGFSRAIVLLEEGTEEFSTIHGIHQIRYSKGNVRETYGHVLATLHREFG